MIPRWSIRPRRPGRRRWGSQHPRYRGGPSPGTPPAARRRRPRAMLVDRVLPAGLTNLGQYAAGDYRPAHSWARSPCELQNRAGHRRHSRSCARFPNSGRREDRLEKRLDFAPDGMFRVSYRWDAVSRSGRTTSLRRSFRSLPRSICARTRQPTSGPFRSRRWPNRSEASTAPGRANR